MNHPQTTAQAFAEEYAERSGVTVAKIAENYLVQRCRCGDEACTGWAMISRDSVRWLTKHGQPWLPYEGVLVSIRPTEKTS